MGSGRRGYSDVMRYTTRIGRVLAGIAGLAVLASCEITAPLPPGATPMEPRAQYQRWWSMVEQCSGLSRPMAEIEWFSVGGGSFRSSAGELVDGLYVQGPERIILAGTVLNDGQVVRHEMLHALIQNNDPAMLHPGEYFLRRCAGVVDCRSACVETAGPLEPPLPAQPGVASNLEITIEVDSVVHRGTYPNFVYVPVTVRARNPLPDPIVVPLQNTNGYRRTFEVVIVPPAKAISGHMNRIAHSSDPRAGHFEPGETKVYVFDIYLSLTETGFGEWSVGGGFTTKSVDVATTFKYQP